MKQVRNFALGALALAPAVSFAAVDVAAVVTEIEGAATPIAAIGAAVLLVMVGIKVFKWVRRAM
jgi:hypothetical protein